MKYFNPNEINLSREDYEIIDPILIRYSDIKNAYKDKKKSLSRINRLSNTDSSWSFFNKKNEPLINMEEKTALEKEVNSLKKQKDQMYYEIKAIISKIISQNNEYTDIYSTYLDYSSYNDDVMSKFKLNMELVKNKKKIDHFFNKLKDRIENNSEIKPEEIDNYKKQYKNIILFLKKVYNEKENKKTMNKTLVDSFDFSSELNLEDAYTVLSIISLLYSSVINPTFNNYKDAYIQYVDRAEYVRRYNERIIYLTNIVIKNA